MPDVVGLHLAKPVVWLVTEAQINYTPVQPSSSVLEHSTTGKGRAGRYQGTLHCCENGMRKESAATRAQGHRY